MNSQLEFDPSDYHLRVMIEDMERDGRSEHAIVDAVRVASELAPTGNARASENRASGRGLNLNGWTKRLRPSDVHRAKSRCAA
jgi:hypothetical protein